MPAVQSMSSHAPITTTPALPVNENSLLAMRTSRAQRETKTPLPSTRSKWQPVTATALAFSMKTAPPRCALWSPPPGASYGASTSVVVCRMRRLDTVIPTAG